MATKRKKTGKRARGEGSVTLRKDGRWQTSMTLEGRKRKYFYGENQAEALEKLHLAQEQQRKGKLATGRQQTVAQFLEDWLENMHRHNLRESSYRIYRNNLSKHALPAFGHLKLQKLNAYEIETLYAKMQQKGYKAETIRSVHRTLRKAFGDAVRWKRLSHNPSDDVKQPGAEEFEAQTLTHEQAKQLIIAAKGTALEALIPLALTTAMRRGEFVGLKWQDINFEEKTLYVRRTVSQVKGKGLVASEPKTAKSKSKLMLPQFVVDALLLQRERQIQMRLDAGDKWQENDLVFSNMHGTFMARQDYLYVRFKKLLAKAGLPDMRFHDLRHSAATILLVMGVHPKQVQEILRHSNISITMNRYAHIIPSMQHKLMDDLDTLFKSE